MKDPTISIVIGCFNHAHTLTRAVRSALTQSRLVEVIIVDDCSTDESSAVGRRLAAEERRIRLVRAESNVGPGGARNRGVRVAAGSHICFLDADDELLGDFCGDAHELMSSRPEMIVVKGEMEFFDPVKGDILPTFDPRHRAVVLSSSCGMLMPRDLFLRMGGFPEDAVFRGPRGGEDVAFMQALMAHAQPIGRIDRPCYRVWSNSGSHIDHFLATTRLAGDSFEFVELHPDQREGSPLAQALAAYLKRVASALTAEQPIGGG